MCQKHVQKLTKICQILKGFFHKLTKTTTQKATTITGLKILSNLSCKGKQAGRKQENPQPGTWFCLAGLTKTAKQTCAAKLLRPVKRYKTTFLDL